nr:hypothetical protein BaRGS_007773 [Batillaria attramentaria]
MNEDQVIETVVPLMDRNSDGNVSRPELVQFFADLSGKQLQVDAQTLHAMTDDELLQLIGNLNITKHDFTQAWHSRFHDSIDFVGATFDALEGLSGDTNGILSAAEIEGIVNDALANFGAARV